MKLIVCRKTKHGFQSTRISFLSLSQRLHFEGKRELGRKIKMPIEIAPGFWVWAGLISESSTNTQLIPIHIYLHRHTLALAPNPIHTQYPTAISIAIFTFSVIQVNPTWL